MSIYRLFITNKDEWLKTYFPEWHEIFGGYPKPVRRTSSLFRSRWAVKVEGQYSPPELFPWLNDSAISVSGKRRTIKEYRTPFGKRQGVGWEAITEDEYIEWCNSINYFKTGIGLDPSVFIGAYRLEDKAHKADRKKYLKELRSAQRQRRLPKWLRPPSMVTCPGKGIYLLGGGAYYANPYGANASFHPNGQQEPSWIDNKWGPDYAAPKTSAGIPGVDYRVVPTRWIANYPGTIPDQDTYDRERYSVWL